MDLGQYIGKKFTIWLTDEHDESVAYGDWIASDVEGNLVLEHPNGRLEVQDEWLERIRAVDDADT